MNNPEKINRDIYDPHFVKDVFDRCSNTYRYWSHVASFGFVWIWRRQAIAALPTPHGPNPKGMDLMAGTGETWSALLNAVPTTSQLVAVDISTGMVKSAIERRQRMHATRVEIREANILDADLPAAEFDYALCTFGLKTFNREQQRRIATVLAQALKPGGSFSFIEASDPAGWIFRPLYNTYLRTVLPLIERLFLKGAQDFAMLGVYAAAFQDCSHFSNCCRELGLQCEMKKHFFGCATGVSGRKPE
jgi:ubiquinone/menaquinone biosynthesis C-methylase UbiE